MQILNKRVFLSCVRSLAALALAVVGMSILAYADDAAILSTVGAESGWAAIEGTQLSLTANLPGGAWLCGGGWEWAQPKQNGDSIALGEEKACAALPVSSAGDYAKPARLTISASIAHFQGAGGIGFWSTVPPRSRQYEAGEIDPETGLELEESVAKRFIGYNGYTGLIFNPAAKTLQVYSGGSMQGSPVSVHVADADIRSYHHLSLTVDTSTGELEFVLFDGKLVSGLTSSAFTDANTSYAGCMSYEGGRTSFKDFQVEPGIQKPVDPVVEIASDRLAAISGDAVAIAVSALNPETEEPVGVLLAETTCAGATLDGGMFRWTAGAPGTYTFVVSATIGSITSRETGTIVVYPVQPPVPTGMKTILLADPAEGAGESKKYAGTRQVDAEDRTKWGLVTNLPDSEWIWNSGYDWAPPAVTWNLSEYTAGNEQGVVLLSLADNGSYSKPHLLYVEVAFTTLSGRGGIGFWSRLRNSEGLAPVEGFTGLSFNRRQSTMTLYEDGVVVAESGRTIEFPEGISVCTVRFVADTRAHAIRDIVFNGFVVGDYSVPSLTDDTTAYVGVASHGNLPDQNSRLGFSSFRVDGLLSRGLSILIR